MFIQEKFYTAEEFWDISHRPEYADKWLELVEGEIREMSRPGGKHGMITSRFIVRIGTWVEEHELGYVTTETGYVLFKKPDGKDTVRGPDVAFVSPSRAPQGLPDELVPFPPDFVVEVVSPNDTADELDIKVAEYLQAGVRLVWVAYPASRSVMVYTPTTTQRLTGNAILDGGDVLPGFKLAVSELFGA